MSSANRQKRWDSLMARVDEAIEEEQRAWDKYGTRRERFSFLFFPKTLFNPETGKEETRWLQFAGWIESCDVALAEDFTYNFWRAIEWCDPAAR